MQFIHGQFVSLQDPGYTDELNAAEQGSLNSMEFFCFLTRGEEQNMSDPAGLNRAGGEKFVFIHRLKVNFEFYRFKLTARAWILF